MSNSLGVRGSLVAMSHSDVFCDRVIALVREHYADFGPTLAMEYLAERHEITISHETLRKLMIQVDGSKHWWFEDRGVKCTLLVYIDDATSELM
jgi:hypothetical protein